MTVITVAYFDTRATAQVWVTLPFTLFTMNLPQKKQNVPPTQKKQISLILSDSFGLQLDLLIAKINVYEKYVTAIVLKHEHKVLRKPSVCYLEGY